MDRHPFQGLPPLATDHSRFAAQESSHDISYLMAYHEIVSLMQSQAHAFGIPLEEIALGDIDPERELL
ncbi:hypothetical protein Pan216_36500 [Planctomycetes bacterium Pan216]|uniref:Uncharacterized protein n=1 Tax=Kolteria novifilia TaxID=2527975 RepID=A0A518B726_9BACT|nr:hypothetical protein Pan216_36500 [Planctomycetes bacterium Pan216]